MNAQGDQQRIPSGALLIASLTASFRAGGFEFTGELRVFVPRRGR
jgi:hypothetical protein